MKRHYSFPIVVAALPFALFAIGEMIHTNHYLLFFSLSLVFAAITLRGSLYLRLLLGYIGLTAACWMVFAYPVGKGYFNEMLFLSANVVQFVPSAMLVLTIIGVMEKNNNGKLSHIGHGQGRDTISN